MCPFVSSHCLKSLGTLADNNPLSLLVKHTKRYTPIFRSRELLKCQWFSLDVCSHKKTTLFLKGWFVIQVPDEPLDGLVFRPKLERACGLRGPT